MISFVYEHPGLTIIIISFLISLTVLLLTKLVTDQKELKRLREETQKLQKELKKVVKSNPEKAQIIQKQIMDLSMKSVRHNFRVTLITLIPLLFIFGWMKANLAYQPIQLSEPVDITVYMNDITYNRVELVLMKNNTDLGRIDAFITPDKKEAKFLVKFSDYGTYIAKINVYANISNKEELIDTAIKYIVVDKYKYNEPVKIYKNKYIKKIVVGNKPLRVLGNFNIFGWYPGWFITYFFSSIFFTILLRKLLKVY